MDVEESKWEGNAVLIRALRARISALQKALTAAKENLTSESSLPSQNVTLASGTEKRCFQLEDTSRSLAHELLAEKEKHRCHVKAVR
mmetsp:Transcript_15925/g.53295  ORF Transcript_15925/g.53295 Transcript_15925/m.53295 type:complete len:87 (-) Transcript_15925:2135-2395(-)